MVLNKLTIDKDIHSFIFGLTVGGCLLVAWLQEVILGLAVRLLPLFGSRMLLLLSSLSVSSPRGIAFLAVLEHLVLMS